MVKVSIVIPVYNRKNFLTVCIKSLLAQSFEDFEICLVDDGSTDGTGLLCDELAEKDTRIRVGTFIKYYKISQLIHTQSIAN